MIGVLGTEYNTFISLMHGKLLIYFTMPNFSPEKLEIVIFSLTKIKPLINVFYHLLLKMTSEGNMIN